MGPERYALQTRRLGYGSPGHAALCVKGAPLHRVCRPGFGRGWIDALRIVFVDTPLAWTVWIRDDVRSVGYHGASDAISRGPWAGTWLSVALRSLSHTPPEASDPSYVTR